jgi:outer membrane protein
MNQRIYLYTIVVSIVTAAIVAVVVLSVTTKKENRVAYVITQTLFDSFEGTKEIKRKIVKIEERQKQTLDSLALEISFLEKRMNANDTRLAYAKNKYNQIFSEMASENQELVQSYNEGLWKQINQYVAEYGKEKGYSFIYGANGSGNLMYVDEGYNITTELVFFINKKYAN